MKTETKTDGAPEVGTLVRRGMSEITYRVIERNSQGTGCRAQATVDEIVEVVGRQPRKLRYTERFVSLAFSPTLTGQHGRTMLIDSEWRVWEVA